MATFAIESAQVVNGSPEVRRMPEASTQSFKEGEFVYLVNGKVTACSSNGKVIWGVAVNDASTTTNADCEVYVANEALRIEMTAYEDGGGVNDTIAYTDLGVKLAIVVVSNKTCCDTGDTDNDAIVIHEFVNEIGDIYPRVICGILPEAIQPGAAAT